ncbi:glycosyltransferase [Sinomonas susongensis]|uniref:glycosyltransferase n=1 Tax=Sinomonas susongensis TaxID=1324851 RepID=UPI001108CBE2|nr:glycosyltransferase [Sinomonas susongensis]
MNRSGSPLRIAHVATLFSPDGAYGGPTRVAVNHAKELIERGHEVTLLGGARGFEQLPDSFDGVPARLFPVAHLVPGSGFAGLFSAGLSAHLLRHARDFDVIHIHLARDLVTLPAALIARRRGVPFVTQTHGMIDASSKLLSRPLDRFLTRPLLGSAERAFYLTQREASDLKQVMGNRDVDLQLLHNGVPVAENPANVLGRQTDVLFLARLHPRKRPRLFVEAARRLAAEFPYTTFSVVGPDEGEGKPVRDLAVKFDPAGRQIRVEGSLQLHETAQRMRQSQIFVLPSENEPFPMTVLEAMSLGLPVIISEDCGLSTAVREADAGIVVDGSVEALAEAISVLLGDESRRLACSANARNLVAQSFSMKSVVDRLEEVYRAKRNAQDGVGSIA